MTFAITLPWCCLLQDITKNFTDSQAAAELAQLLQLPWSSAALATATENVAVQVSRKGKALVQINPSKPQQQQQSQKQQQALAGSATSKADSSAQPSPDLQQLSVSELFGGNSSSNSQQQQPDPQQQVLISLQHDRVKSTPINGSVADAFLFKIGLQTADGKIRANMQVCVYMCVCLYVPALNAVEDKLVIGWEAVLAAPALCYERGGALVPSSSHNYADTTCLTH